MFGLPQVSSQVPRPSYFASLYRATTHADPKSPTDILSPVSTASSITAEDALSTEMGFDFERMICAFESIETEYRSTGQPLPSSSRFLEAMLEVNALFETLGSAFSFVKRDIERKITVVNRYATIDPTNFSQLTSAVNYEIANRKLTPIHLDNMPNCSRTLLRLMWALKFADNLLDGLAQAFNPNSSLSYSNRTLRWAVGRAYEETLAEHHSWTIRRAVKGACLVLPSKESFMDRVGVEPHRSEPMLARLATSMSPLVTRMYAFYEKHGLLNLA